MKAKRRRFFAGLLLSVLVAAGCSAPRNAETMDVPPDQDVAEQTQAAESAQEEAEQESETEEQQLLEDQTRQIPERNAVQAKGIYISAYVAGTPALVDNLLKEFDQTEANALVIDFKDDFGRVVCETESPLVQQLASTKVYIEDMAGLMQKLKEHHIYTIARIPAFRDAWLSEAQPD